MGTIKLRRNHTSFTKQRPIQLVAVLLTVLEKRCNASEHAPQDFLGTDLVVSCEPDGGILGSELSLNCCE
jgi:hypothetical protein